MTSIELAPGSIAKTRSGLASTITASTIGTIVEWYDFLLYATAAALIFNKLFFPQFDPVAGTIASFAAYAVGFLVRPIGGIVFGWLGDRIGRKPVLLATLIMMGLATSCIGLLPTYAQAGIMAPILLVLLRIIQGFGAGAEYAGAIVMAAEAAPDRRGFYASLPAAAVDVATVVSAGVFALFALMPEDAFLAWGWRIPFLLSFGILLLGVFIRRRVPESPEFIAIKDKHRDARMPVIDLLKNHPRAVLTAMGANLGPNLSYIFQTFTLAYATGKLGFPKQTILAGVMASSAVGAIACIVFGSLSDRFGRRPIMILGGLFTALYALVYFHILGAGTPMIAVLAMVVGHALGARSMFGVQPSFYCDLFPAEVRYSAIAFAREVTGAVVLGPLPLLATALLGWSDGEVWPIAGLTAVLSLITLICVALAPAPRGIKA
jgi:MFS transporter, MHS family, shikimate and dehydroshikimate transport protein